MFLRPRPVNARTQNRSFVPQRETASLRTLRRGIVRSDRENYFNKKALETERVSQPMHEVEQRKPAVGGQLHVHHRLLRQVGTARLFSSCTRVFLHNKRMILDL
ncbi:hypothetical protein T265_02902 [Opisthorchis viverrini]|uniref:Uncharacterized protein n=1 Tax=Opisthorchis viverrini TaxID=6198 RepID=A0A074ZXS6_OPIVI|nr:hypothetical protein T265_02902 [Opisthorchis viverrini]KER30757.1 hypothetical protein T265_02902 [Opisthorchis viverrini]